MKLEENLKDEELDLNNSLPKENELDKNESSDSLALDNTINDISKTLENNISEEIEKLDVNESLWSKISKSKTADIVKVAIESVLKGILKKKFGINFSTFNDMKKTIENVMDGNLKDAVKNGSDAAIDKLDMLDSTAKITIKKIKNSVVDKTIDSEKYEIVNKQTKIINRISKNCEEFNDALKVNDSDVIKRKANSIKKDMEKILPIKETIVKAQCALDKYDLWKNKGKEQLTKEENELVEKLYISA